MAFTKWFVFPACSAFIVLATVLSWLYSAQAAEPLASDGKVLLAKYLEIKADLEKNQFGIPIYFESKEEYSSLHVDVYGILDYPFDSVLDALQAPSNWCEITSLVNNIKACTSYKVSDQWLLTLFSGRKYYQPPQDAYKLDFRFNIAAIQPEYMEMSLSAKNGPFFTRDHRIKLEAAPLDKGRTFIHFGYDYGYGALARAAIKSYYATIGFDKKGFSVIATDENGDPVYLGGVRGSVERNGVRYYLAIQTYMDTLEIPWNERFEKRISRWYDLTTQSPRQLYEMDKGEYLNNKRLEHTNQLMLQMEADK